MKNMSILEEKNRKKSTALIVALAIVILPALVLLIFWSLSSVGKVSFFNQAMTISLSGAFGGDKETLIADAVIEMDIFQDPKFQALKSFAVLPVAEGSVGRDNPFSPPYIFSPIKMFGAEEREEIFLPQKQ